jgi:hypothetical protein
MIMAEVYRRLGSISAFKSLNISSFDGLSKDYDIG